MNCGCANLEEEELSFLEKWYLTYKLLIKQIKKQKVYVINYIIRLDITINN